MPRSRRTRDGVPTTPTLPELPQLPVPPMPPGWGGAGQGRGYNGPPESGDPATVALLRRAIGERRQVVATYEGRRREFCPHALGTKDGDRRVLGWQFAGESGSALPDWRCYRVAGLAGLTIRAGEWHGGSTDPVASGCLDTVEVAAA